MNLTKRNLLTQVSVFAIYALATNTAFANSLPVDKDGDFPDSCLIDNNELSVLRGGFNLPSGMTIRFSYNAFEMRNGETIRMTSFNEGDLANAIQVKTQQTVNDALNKAGITPSSNNNSNNGQAQTTANIATNTPPSNGTPDSNSGNTQGNGNTPANNPSNNALANIPSNPNIPNIPIPTIINNNNATETAFVIPPGVLDTTVQNSIDGALYQKFQELNVTVSNAQAAHAADQVFKHAIEQNNLAF